MYKVLALLLPLAHIETQKVNVLKIAAVRIGISAVLT